MSRKVSTGSPNRSVAAVGGIEAAQEECRKTLTGNNNVPIAERVRKMSQAFAGYGVTVELLERSLRHKLASFGEGAVWMRQSLA